MSFDSGFQTGAQIMGQVQARRQQKDEFDTTTAQRKREYDEGAPMREVETRMQQTRLDKLRTDMTADEMIRQRDLKNFTTADAALKSYDTARAMIPTDDPDRFNKLDQLKEKYMPEIGKHAGVIKQFEAYNTADQANEAWVQNDRMKSQLAGFNKTALDLGLGPEVFSIQNDVKAGKKTLADAITEISGLVKTKKDEHEELVQDRLIKRVTAPVEERNKAFTNRPGLNAEDHVTLARVKALQSRAATLDRLYFSATTATRDKVEIKAQRDEVQKELDGLTKPKAQAVTAADAVQAARDAIQRGADPAAVGARYRQIYGHDLPADQPGGNDDGSLEP